LNYVYLILKVNPTTGVQLAAANSTHLNIVRKQMTHILIRKS